jgi:PAS domain S-box-containing protein
MTYEGDSVDSLRERLGKLEGDLKRRDEQIARLEKANRELSQRVQESPTEASGGISEIEETLKRLVTRIAMIVQGTKCLIMIREKDTGDLVGDPPALGFDDVDLKQIRVSATEGISGEVFQSGEPTILYDAESDERAIRDKLATYGVRNGVSVPLIIERRDEETNKVLERDTIGVLHVFNKRFGSVFIDEDIQLLSRLARNAAAVINTAYQYHQIVKEKEEVVNTIQSLAMGLVLINKNQRVTQMNHSAMRIFGLTKDDLAGGKTYDAVIKDQAVLELFRKAISEETEEAVEVVLPNPDIHEQLHTFQIQTATVRNESGETIGMAAILNDITEIKNVDKMKTAFVSTVSHELRTPLTSIKGFVSTLLQDTEGWYDDATRHEFYSIIDNECDRLRRLIDDLLNVSRIEDGKALEMNIGEVNIRKNVEKVVTIQSGSTYKKPNHTISFSLDADLPEIITADGDKVEQILNNLISNALKYSPNGGEVKIVGKMLDSETMQFSVSDQGMGIPAEYLPKMFGRFVRVDNSDVRSVGGTGIGLFLTKALVEQHGGRIWLESEYGKGTTFYFTLPTFQSEGGDSQELARKVAG